jgi:hypothetical protein
MYEMRSVGRTDMISETDDKPLRISFLPACRFRHWNIESQQGLKYLFRLPH